MTAGPLRVRTAALTGQAKYACPARKRAALLRLESPMTDHHCNEPGCTGSTYLIHDPKTGSFRRVDQAEYEQTEGGHEYSTVVPVAAPNRAARRRARRQH